MEAPGLGPTGSSGRGLWPREALPHGEQSPSVPSTSLLVKFPNLHEPQFLTLVKRVCDLIGLLRVSPEITGPAPKNALQIQVSYAPHKLPWTPLVFSGFLSTLQLCAACSGWNRGGQLNKPTGLSPDTKAPQRTFLTTAMMLPAPGTRLHLGAGSPHLKGPAHSLWDPVVPAGNRGDGEFGLTARCVSDGRRNQQKQNPTQRDRATRIRGSRLRLNSQADCFLAVWPWAR